MLARKSPRVMTTPGVSGMSEAAVVVEKVGDFALFGLEVVACVVWVATDAEDSFRTRMNPAGNIVVNGEWKERRTGDARRWVPGWNCNLHPSPGNVRISTLAPSALFDPPTALQPGPRWRPPF